MFDLRTRTGLGLCQRFHPRLVLEAKLLLEFLLSEEGQKVVADANYLPALSSVPAMVKGLRPTDGGFKTTWLQPETTYPHLAEWGNVVRDLFR